MKKLLLIILPACAAVPVAPVQQPKINIEEIVRNSECAKYSFKNRGRAPIAYLIGMAKVYAETCKDQPRALIGSDKDANAWYGLTGSNLDTYTLLLGLGMRESSGKYCEGRDLSANNVTASTAEAGMFQFSYNSIGASNDLVNLFNHAKSGDLHCALETFQQNITCKQSDRTIYGSGNGADFQRLARQCPGFAVRYGAVLIRVLRKHFGPLNRKEAEVVPACREMLSKVCQ
jgi:hypothetical protein